MSDLYLVFSRKQFRDFPMAWVVVDAESGKSYIYTPGAESGKKFQVMAISDNLDLVTVGVAKWQNRHFVFEDISSGSTAKSGLDRLPLDKRAKAEHAIADLKAGAHPIISEDPNARAAFEATRHDIRRTHETLQAKCG